MILASDLIKYRNLETGFATNNIFLFDFNLQVIEHLFSSTFKRRNLSHKTIGALLFMSVTNVKYTADFFLNDVHFMHC